MPPKKESGNLMAMIIFKVTQEYFLNVLGQYEPAVV